ncbi:MAG: 6-hydroxymethylpterin diphosphokinase MptE-like protein [Halanaeroarchaeum sp.]
MDFTDWEPIYERILADFGYDRAADERSRDLLAGLIEPFDLSRLDVEGRTVAIAGGADSLGDEHSTVRAADVVFAASTAADHLRDAGLAVDLVVTDLDKHPETAVELSRSGTPVAVHAHGDNVGLIEEVVPAMAGANVLGTTQAEPVGPVRNFGGFTDGDRAAFLADHLDATTLTFPGWDFDDPTVGPEKQRKLEWAERLLVHLERRRGDRWTLLDDRRDDVDEPLSG